MRRSKWNYPNASSYPPNFKVILINAYASTALHCTALVKKFPWKTLPLNRSPSTFFDFSSAVNPFKKVPAIVDGRFKLFERYFNTIFNCVVG